VQSPEGTVTLSTKDGIIRTFEPNGKYSWTSNSRRQQQARRTELEQKIRIERQNRQNNGELDSKGNLRKELETNDLRPNSDAQTYHGSVSWNKEGVVVEAHLSSSKPGAEGTYASIHRVDNNSFRIVTSNSEYLWHGEIKGIKAASGRLEGIEFVPRSGSPLKYAPENLEAGAELRMAEKLVATAQFTGYRPLFGYARIDNNGNLFLRGTKYQVPTVNGKEVGSTEVLVTPGDKVELKVDIGDRYQHWENRSFVWGRTLDGKSVTLNGKVLEPNTVTELQEWPARP
jgi:hypothetical protein